MVCTKVRGWTSGRSLPVLNFVKYFPPVPETPLYDPLYLIVPAQRPNQMSNVPLYYYTDIIRSINSTITLIERFSILSVVNIESK